MGKTLEDISRRQALALLVGTGGALALACGSSIAGTGGVTDGGDGGPGTGGDAGDAGSDGGTASCEVTPEGEVGPFFADDSGSGFNRSNILSNLDGTNTQTGVPLTLTLTVLDVQKSCAAYVGAQIDIWHCNAAGVYSDIAQESTASEQWLRGYQVTDSNGQVSFKTILPGWYSGRTAHIHIRIRSSYSEASATTDETNTTQLFFPQAFMDTLDTTVAPYSSEGKNPTTNTGDHVYTVEENGANVLALSGDMSNGYTAAATIFLPITTE